MNYDMIKRKVDKVFCIPNLREMYKSDEYDFKMSFLDLMFCIEDFYTFVYSTKISRNSWLLFTWIRTLVRYDGYVKLSYKDISNKFCDSKPTMSKPTFFKCINELDEFGLIKRISNKKLFDNKYQNDVNTYIVINKIDEILPLLEQVNNQVEFYQLLRETYFNSNLKVKENKKVQVSENKQEYSYEYIVNEEYPEVKNEIEDFFKFLGSANKTKQIAKSRKTKILNMIMHYYPDDDGLVYAIEQTITKGVKNEKYLYAILKNICGDNKEEKQKDDEVTKQLKEKYKQKQTKSYSNECHLSDSEYDKLKERALTKEQGFLIVLQEMKKKLKSFNNREQKLYDVCMKLKSKFAIHKRYEENRGMRLNVLGDYGISECYEYDNKWNEIIYWVYDKDDSVVPLNVINKFVKKYKEEFTFSNVQYLNGGVY